MKVLLTNFVDVDFDVKIVSKLLVNLQDLFGHFLKVRVLDLKSVHNALVNI